MKSTPCSTAVCTTRTAAARSAGSPQTPGPGSCMAPAEAVDRRSPMVNVSVSSAVVMSGAARHTARVFPPAGSMARWARSSCCGTGRRSAAASTPASPTCPCCRRASAGRGCRSLAGRSSRRWGRPAAGRPDGRAGGLTTAVDEDLVEVDYGGYEADDATSAELGRGGRSGGTAPCRATPGRRSGRSARGTGCSSGPAPCCPTATSHWSPTATSCGCSPPAGSA